MQEWKKSLWLFCSISVHCPGHTGTVYGWALDISLNLFQLGYSSLLMPNFLPIKKFPYLVYCLVIAKVETVLKLLLQSDLSLLIFSIVSMSPG